MAQIGIFLPSPSSLALSYPIPQQLPQYPGHIHTLIVCTFILILVLEVEVAWMM